MHRRLAGRVAFRVEGLSLEKLLNLCYTQHIRLQHVDRDGLRTVSASVAYADWPVICAISEKRGWKLTVGRMSGWPTWRTWLHRRAMLAAGMGVFVAGCIFAMACVWQVEIRDAGPYIGEVRSVLAEREIHPGRFFGQLDLESLKEALQMRLTGLSWVGVERQGVRLVIRCVEGVMPGEIAQGGLPGDMVASRGGIVCDIRVIAGIARVQPGDIVRTGQVLIEGVERTSKGENKPVQARGSVRARVWLTGRATIPMRETLTLPTGASTMRRVFCTPWIAWSPTEKPDYKQMDCDIQTVQIGGLLPVWLRTERYEEVVYREQSRPEEAVRAEALRAALQIAREKAGLETEIVDKWANYCMIEEGYCAEVVLETVQEIGREARTG